MRHNSNSVSSLLVQLAVCLGVCYNSAVSNYAHPTYYFAGDKHHYHDYNPDTSYFPYKSNSYEGKNCKFQVYVPEHSNDPYYHLYHPREKHTGYYYCNERSGGNRIHHGSPEHNHRRVHRPAPVDDPVVAVIETGPPHPPPPPAVVQQPVPPPVQNAPIIPITINNFPPTEHPRPYVSPGVGPIRPLRPARPVLPPRNRIPAGRLPGSRRRPAPIPANPRRPGAAAPGTAGRVPGSRRPPGNRIPPRNYPQNPIITDRRPANRRPIGQDGPRRRPSPEGSNVGNINYNK